MGYNNQIVFPRRNTYHQIKIFNNFTGIFKPYFFTAKSTGNIVNTYFLIKTQ